MRSIQQTLLYLLFTLSFIQVATATPCDGRVAAFKEWVQQRHAMDAEIPRRRVAHDVEQEVYTVIRASDNLDSHYDFSVHGNSDGVTNVDIPFFSREKQSQFFGNEVLYFEIYSANYRFGLIDGFAGHVVLPDTLTFKVISNEPTLPVVHLGNNDFQVVDVIPTAFIDPLNDG